MQVAFLLHAPVQPGYQNMENMDTVDKITPRYGTIWTLYHHMYRVDVSSGAFESAGCASPFGDTIPFALHPAVSHGTQLC